MEGFLTDKPTTALEHFTEAVRICEENGYRGIQFRSLMGAFHAALDLGDHDRARALLDRFGSLQGQGTAWILRQDAARMRAALAAAEPVRVSVGLPGGLTPREAEVLLEVAKGSSNRQVGQTLFISAKTVSVHLSNVMGKLGADNRTAAVARARELGLL